LARVGGRAALAAAVTLTVAGGALGFAAHRYRTGIPEKRAADVVLVQQDAATARAAFLDRYGPARGVPHFRRLAIIWSVVATVAAAVALGVRSPAAKGVGGSLVFLCAASFLLDLSAFRRDNRYADYWLQLQLSPSTSFLKLIQTGEGHGSS
jgi:hypothetical protein